MLLKVWFSCVVSGVVVFKEIVVLLLRMINGNVGLLLMLVCVNVNGIVVIFFFVG